MKRKSRKRPQISLHSLLGVCVPPGTPRLSPEGQSELRGSVSVWGGMGGLHSWEMGVWSFDAHALEREPNG